jgi:hypothetical protein
MATPHRSLWRVIALSLATAASGCAARASYVYDEPVVYERRPARVYVAPPPVYYHQHPVERRYYVEPRAYRAPVHKAPGRAYRAPAARHHHHRDHHGDSRRDDDDRRERRHRH